MDERLAPGVSVGFAEPARGTAGPEADQPDSLASTTTVFICTRCRLPGSDRAAEPLDGERLLTALLDAARGAMSPTGPEIRGVACLSNCNRPCTVAFVGPGKLTTVYGELGTDPEDAAAVLAMAGLYAASANGITVWRDRPERLRRGLIACVPPFGFVGDPVLAGHDTAR